MIAKMLSQPSVLSEGQLEWVQKIATTADEFDHFKGYTPRQCEVIAGIYKDFKKENSPQKIFPIVTDTNEGVIQGNFG